MHWIFSNNQARESVYCDHFIVRFAVSGHKHAAAAILLGNDLPNFIFRQSKRLLRAGELVNAAQQRRKNAHENLPFTF